jgi:hypothetical protein
LPDRCTLERVDRRFHQVEAKFEEHARYFGVRAPASQQTFVIPRSPKSW